jgi:hypothetical protein
MDLDEDRPLPPLHPDEELEIYNMILDKNESFIREKMDQLNRNRLERSNQNQALRKLRLIARLYFEDWPNLTDIGHPEWTFGDGARTIDNFKVFLKEHPHVSKYILTNGYRGGRSYKSKRSKRFKKSRKSRK